MQLKDIIGLYYIRSLIYLRFYAIKLEDHDLTHQKS